MDRRELLHQVRELIELDRGFGVEFVPRRAAAATAPATLPPAALAPAIVPTPRAVAAPAAPTPVVARSPAATPPAPAAPSGVVVGSSDQAVPGEDLAAIHLAISTCRACGLCATRTTTVPGEGAQPTALMFIGEGPGAEEDAQGRPFVGPAGQLLDKMIRAMGLARAEVFITNVVKCRPPGNRNPEPAEIQACSGFLQRQITLLQPQVICTLGNVPLRALFGAEQPGITRVHGQKLSLAHRGHAITVIPTFHPSYLLRNEQAKKPAWEDLQVVLKELGRSLPKRGG
jgi:uracil-DNA glycosylase family 4